MPISKRPWELDSEDGAQYGPFKLPKLASMSATAPKQSSANISEINPGLKEYIASIVQPYEKRIATLEGQIRSLKRHLGDSVMDMGGFSSVPDATSTSPNEQLQCLKRHLGEAVMDMGGSLHSTWMAL